MHTHTAAGFHDASLYDALRPAIPALVQLLSDEEDRTRANAAGALGNLVRNSSMLCAEVVGAGALQALMATVQRGVDGDAGAASSVQIGLFSLGNLCSHGEVADALQQQGLPQVSVKVRSVGVWG
jgi:fused-like protein